MTVYHTADLGWTTGQTGATTRSLLSSIFNTMSSGDELVLGALYKFTGTGLNMPAGTTLSAAYGGGLDDTLPSGTNQYILRPGEGCTIRNVTFACTAGPDGSYPTFHWGRRAREPGEPDGPQDFTHVNPRKALSITASDVTIEYCDFTGVFANSIELSGAKRTTVYRCHFWRGRYQMRWIGAVHDTLIEDCVFEQAMQDAIKTFRSGLQGTQRPTVRGCIFQNTYRDAIDTTGGFKDAWVYRCEFRRITNIDGGGAFDLKTIIETDETAAETLGSNLMNKNILVEECLLSDVRFLAILTLDDKSGNKVSANPSNQYYAPLWCPQDIRFLNCISEKSSGGTSPHGNHGQGNSLVRLKGAHTAVVTNLQRRGSVGSTFSLQSGRFANNPAVLATLNYGYSATFASDASAQPSTTDYPSYVGPQGALPTPEVPEVNALAFSINPATGLFAAQTDLTGPGEFNLTVRAWRETGSGIEYDTSPLKVVVTAP